MTFSRATPTLLCKEGRVTPTGNSCHPSAEKAVGPGSDPPRLAPRTVLLPRQEPGPAYRSVSSWGPRPRDSFPEHVGHLETFSQRLSPDAASLPHTVPPSVVCVSGTDTEHTRRLAVFLSMKVTLTGACSPGLGRELEAGPRGHEVAVTF